jgi:hypothetical protein
VHDFYRWDARKRPTVAFSRARSEAERVGWNAVLGGDL